MTNGLFKHIFTFSNMLVILQWTVKINYQSVDELSSTTSLYAFKRASLFFRISIAILLFPHVLENYVTVFCAHDHMTHFVYDGRKLSRTSTKNFQEADILQKLSDRYWFCFSFDWYFHNISFYYCFLYLIFSLEMNTWNDIILRHSFQSKKKIMSCQPVMCPQARVNIMYSCLSFVRN